ncbi:MAG: hypothetical protein ABEJ90_04555 [Halobacterium sp.]
MSERLRTLSLLALLFIGAGLTPTVSIAADGEAITDTRGVAVPPTPNETSTHSIQARVGPGLANETLSRIVVDYGGTDISLADVEYRDLEGYVGRNRGTADYERRSLPAATLSANETAVTVEAAGTLELEVGDWVVVNVGGVQNPETLGGRNVTISVAGETAATATAHLSIQYPPPRLGDQGIVGGTNRIAVHSPEDSGGFVVATVDGEVVGTTDLPEDQNVHMDVGIDSIVSADVAPDATVTLTAYRDTNGDGEYTSGVDEAWTRDGERVEISVANALATATTTSSTTTPTTATTAHVDTTTATTATSSITTRTTTTGFGLVTVLLSCAVVSVLRRRR